MLHHRLASRRRLISAVLGTVLALLAVTASPALGEAAQQVQTSYAFGYQKAPAYYDLSQGPATITFSYTVQNLTSSPIATNVEFIADRIISFMGVDVSDGQPGQPGYTENQLGSNVNQTIQQFYVVYQMQPLSLPAGTTKTVTFTAQLPKCGYYQLDSDAVTNTVSGLFATGFTRVIGCNPTVSTTPAPSAGAIGSVISDGATLVGGSNPTGSITFSLYGPNDPTCSGTNLVAGQNGFVKVTLSGRSATSAGYTTSQLGTYNWVAAYSGDTVNKAAVSACGAEQVVIGKAQPEIDTTPTTSDATVGAVISDGAVVSGGYSPSGTVTFALYGPNDSTCTGPNLVASDPTFADTPLSNGSASSPGYTTGGAGTYEWVATYNGDAANQAASSPCGSEAVVINKAQPSISTVPSAGSVTVGASISDTATVSGGYQPTGSVTFALYGPGDSSCSGTNLVAGLPGFANVPLSGGSAGSPDFGTTAVGTYRWVATYNGDGNNKTAASGCADEQVTTSSAQPGVGTTPTPLTGAVGVTISDSASINGGYSPTGTVTFALYAPGDNACSGSNLVAGLSGFSSVPLVGGTASSAGYTTTQLGTYRWVVTYSGDANNAAAASTCGAEAVTVTKQVGNQGCTPGFWKNQNHYSLWTGYSPAQLVGSVFTIPTTLADGSSGSTLANATLAGALAFQGGSTLNGAAQILLRAAVAGILNGESSQIAYALTPSQIITGVNTALASGSRTQILDLATVIDNDNNGLGGCPLS